MFLAEHALNLIWRMPILYCFLAFLQSCKFLNMIIICKTLMFPYSLLPFFEIMFFYHVLHVFRIQDILVKVDMSNISFIYHSLAVFLCINVIEFNRHVI